MFVTVRFYGSYRRLIDSPEVGLELDDDATALDLVRLLGERVGETLRAALLAEKERGMRLQSGVRIAVGDEVIDFASELQKPLITKGSGAPGPIRVFIFPPLMGGR